MGITRRTMVGGLIATPLAGALAGPFALKAAPPPNGGYVFAYFKHRDKQNPGLRLAISRDGMRYTALGGDRPVAAPLVGNGRLFRDPFIRWDAARRRYHMVWTTGWQDKTIGYASSPDLVTWSAPRALPVMAAFPTARNTWAPEFEYDAARCRFVIFWASTVPGPGAAEKGESEDGYSHRIYATTTRDFVGFTPTQLMFDPGYSVIDTTFVRAGGKLRMVFKDERLVPERKVLQWCDAASITGPFGPPSPAFSPAWVEGPMIIDNGADTLVFYDEYRENRFGVLSTTDWREWRNRSGDITLPTGASHGSVLRVDELRLRALERLV